MPRQPAPNGFVERLKGADGVYFNSLKLTAKGEQTAIQQREAAERLEKELSDVVPRANAVIAEIKTFEDKKNSH